MMLFSSFFWLSFMFFFFFVLDSCRPTAAATLAASPLKHRAFNRVECSARLPPLLYLAGYPPRFPSTTAMCASSSMDPQNLQCICEGSDLICGSTRVRRLQRMIYWCIRYCHCGPHTRFRKDISTIDLDYRRSHTGINTPNIQTLPSGNIPTGNSHTCSGTCTSVNLGCASQSPGECTCFAPPVGLFYWHQGDCGTRLPFKAKRDLAQQRYSYYLNATAKFASSDKVTTPAGPLPDHAAQLASGLLPSPCNASYISFACGDSKDGIVHEPPQNWLGALLPEGVKELPPVPQKFLNIQGGKQGNFQVLRTAVD